MFDLCNRYPSFNVTQEERNKRFLDSNRELAALLWTEQQLHRENLQKQKHQHLPASSFKTQPPSMQTASSTPFCGQQKQLLLPPPVELGSPDFSFTMALKPCVPQVTHPPLYLCIFVSVSAFGIEILLFIFEIIVAIVLFVGRECSAAIL